MPQIYYEIRAMWNNWRLKYRDSETLPTKDVLRFLVHLMEKIENEQEE